MQTATQTDDLTALDLDFDPTCEVDEVTKQGVKYSECRAPAVWIGVGPCGHDSYFCETCHYDQRSHICRQCGNKTLLAAYNWTRLKERPK
jgi:hypothetical protein